MTLRAAWARAGIVLGAVLAADQATKALVRAGLERGERDPVLPGVELVHVENRGIAFGVLQDGGALLLALTVVALLALLAFFAAHARRPGAWLATGLVLGGAAGNALDRLRQGSVTDWIDVPLWPAFNLADVAITAGVLALLWVLEGLPRSRPAADGE